MKKHKTENVELPKSIYPWLFKNNGSISFYDSSHYFENVKGQGKNLRGKELRITVKPPFCPIDLTEEMIFTGYTWESDQDYLTKSVLQMMHKLEHRIHRATS